MSWSDWSVLPTGGKSIKNDDSVYRAGRKEELLADIALLQAEDLIRVDWVERGHDPARIHYRLEDMGRFYELAGITPKWERIRQQQEMIDEVRERVQTSWILAYLDEEYVQLSKGMKSALLSDENLPVRKRLYDCLVGLDYLNQCAQSEKERDAVPMLHRVFSKRFLGNSKMFEAKEKKDSEGKKKENGMSLRDRVCSLARQYRPDIPKDEDEMDDIDVLEHLYIEGYSQELTIKGSLRFELQGKILDTADYPYGLVLNQQTLTHLTLCAKQSIHLVRMIENKANFVAEPYENGKLVIFSHGYITPGERKFLISLRDILEKQSDPVTYQHSGDMDYGGICIYRYLREKVFPNLKPYRMDIATYEECTARGMSEEITEAMAEKIGRLSDDVQLGELAARLAADRRVVEQEAYLT